MQKIIYQSAELFVKYPTIALLNLAKELDDRDIQYK